MFLLCFISFVSADSIGSFQLDVDNVEIYQTCNNCTYCNFTRVMAPNNQTILSNLVALEDGTYYYYLISKGNFTESGDYIYTYNCGNLLEKETGSIEFTISYTGKELDDQQVTIYLGAIFVLIFFFILIVLLINKLPSKDSTDESGIILQVSNLKHLRPVLWGISWGIILALMFIIANISIAFLPTGMIGGLFFSLYTIMFWITIVALPVWLIWIFVNIFRDKEVKSMIERGVDVRTP